LSTGLTGNRPVGNILPSNGSESAGKHANTRGLIYYTSAWSRLWTGQPAGACHLGGQVVKSTIVKQIKFSNSAPALRISSASDLIQPCAPQMQSIAGNKENAHPNRQRRINPFKSTERLAFPAFEMAIRRGHAPKPASPELAKDQWLDLTIGTQSLIHPESFREDLCSSYSRGSSSSSSPGNEAKWADLESPELKSGKYIESRHFEAD
jgi:hypothetical protein